MANKKGIFIMSIILGIVGVIVVLLWDIITEKAVNDITGPKSIGVLAISVILLVLGIINFKKTKQK